MSGSKAARRVALVCEGLERGFGGMEHYILMLARQLDRDRYQPVVIGMAPDFGEIQAEFVARLKAAEVPVLVAGSPRRGKVRHAADTVNVFKLMRSARIDLAHIHTCKPLGGQKIIVGSRLAGVPAVIRTEHMSPSSIFRNNPGYERRKVFMKPFDWLTDRVVTVCEADREEQIGVVGRKAAKVYRSYGGIELERFNPAHDVAAAKARLGLDPALPVVGAVGRLNPQKGFTYLVDAAAKVIKEYGPVNFLLVGGGGLEDSLKEQVKELGLEGYFRLAGFQSDVRPYMEAFDLAVMPSLYEGFPLALLEYMALAKPVVVSDLACFKEALGEEAAEVTTRLADSASLAEGLLRLLRDPAHRQRMAQANLQRVRREFSIERLTDDMMQLYDTSLDHRPIKRQSLRNSNAT